MPNVYDPSQKSGVSVSSGSQGGGFSVRLDDLIDVSTVGGQAYQVLYRRVDGTYALKPVGYGTILGYYPNEGALTTAHPTGLDGQAYIVSTDLYIWDSAQWRNVGPFRGEPGEPGEDGSGIVVKGTADWSVISALPTPQPGDMWIVETDEIGVADSGDGMVWTGSAWDNVGQIRGPAGATGAAGPVGTQGPQGPAGAAGAAGAQGPQGIKGDTGNTGAASTVPGPQGVKGDTGDTGAASTVPGPQGSQGPAGADGAEGPQGPQGSQGIQGDDGADGPQGIQGPAGADGADGAQGIQGPAGGDGAQGPQGIQGEDGPQGPQGIQGIQGEDGADGATGPGGNVPYQNDPPSAPTTGDLWVDADATGLAYTAANLAVTSAGFNGVLATGDDTVQKVAQKVDDISAFTTSAPGFVPAAIATHNAYSALQGDSSWRFAPKAGTADVIGGWRWTSAVDTDATATGELRFDTTDSSTSTLASIAETSFSGAGGINCAGAIQRARIGDHLLVVSATDPTKWLRFKIVSTVTDSGTYNTFSVVRLGASATTPFTNLDVVSVSILPGTGPRSKEFSLGTGNAATSTGALRWYNDTGETLYCLSGRASVGTAPSTTSLIVDVNKNGTTIFSTRPAIASGTFTNKSAVFLSSAARRIADGDYITIDVDQVGSPTTGAALAVQLDFV